MNARIAGRRGILSGAGAAALTAAAVFVAPAASAAPTDQAEDAAQAVQEQVRQSVERAEQALTEARQQAEADVGGGSQAAEEEAQRAVEEAEQALTEARQALQDAQQSVQVDDWLPDGLQRDLRELHDVPADQRAERLQDILRSGLDGGYGGDVQQWTQQLQGFLSSVPEDLRDDLGQLSDQEPGQLREDLGGIVDSARSGRYGLRPETWTDWARDAVERWNLSGALDGGSGDGGN